MIKNISALVPIVIGIVLFTLQPTLASALVALLGCVPAGLICLLEATVSDNKRVSALRDDVIGMRQEILESNELYKELEATVKNLRSEVSIISRDM